MTAEHSLQLETKKILFQDCISEAPMICSHCANRLASAYDFAMKVSESDKRFADLYDESSTSKMIECVDDDDGDDDVEFVSGADIVQINEVADASNLGDEMDDTITVSDPDDGEGITSYVIKTARPMGKKSSNDDGNYVAVPQYTVTTQRQDYDLSDPFLSKDHTTAPVTVKTVDVAAVHINANESLDFTDSLMNKEENDKDSFYQCKYCPKGELPSLPCEYNFFNVVLSPPTVAQRLLRPTI